MDYTAIDRYLDEELGRLLEEGTTINLLFGEPTETFLTATAPFYQELQRFDEALQPYVSACQELFEVQKKTVVRWEYGRGGFVSPRGYYYPCPVTDLYVGGFSRGRLLKRLKGANPPDYIFGFNSQNHLVTVEHYTVEGYYQQEAIFYEGNVSQGIRFQNSNIGLYILDARKCVYYGDRLVFMETAEFDPYHKTNVQSIHIEEYTYSAEGIQTHSVFNFNPQYNFVSHRIQGFSHDSEGYVKDTWQIGATSRTRPNPFIYPITKKRKV